MAWWHGLGRRQRVGPDWYRANGRIGTAVRWDGLVAVRVRGRSGTYVAFGSPRALDCTCSARQLPCPHVRAVAAELEENEGRFVDLRRALARLPGPPAPAEAIERLLLSHPDRVLDAVERNDPGQLRAAADVTAV